MQKSTWVVVTLAGLLAVVGCEKGTGGAGDGSAGAPHTPEPNGVPMNEGDACEALLNAFEQHAIRLRCTFTSPTCPGHIRVSGAPHCSQYDEGSIMGCADLYATFTSCSEFEQRHCQIYNIDDSAPAGCPEQDAGADAQADAQADGRADAQVETEAEPGEAAAE
jgi:hypothetical protein